MTFIAITLHGDHAEVVADSGSYSASVSFITDCTKVWAVPHLDAVVAVQGESTFGDVARLSIMNAAGAPSRPGFDETVAQIAPIFQGLWNHRPGAQETTVYLVGYSQRAGAFEAWSFTSGETTGRAFEPVAITQPYVIPCPWSLQPTSEQVARHFAWDHETAPAQGREPADPALADAWSSMPPMIAPKGDTEWVEFAQMVRRERSFGTYAKVLITGDLFHTRLSRGEVTTRRIHTFGDADDEFMQMMRYTFHPVSQLSDCYCGSGKTFLDCHLAYAKDQTCTCGTSGRTFAECCMVRPGRGGHS